MELLLTLTLPAFLLVALCTLNEKVYAAIAPVEEPDNFLRPLDATNRLLPLTKTSKSNVWTETNRLPDVLEPPNTPKAKTNGKTVIARPPFVRKHLKNLKSHLGDKSFYMDSVASDSGSKDKNSFESQRRAFLDILDRRMLEPKRRKKHHGSNKIKLRYDYINRKYSITEDSEDS